MILPEELIPPEADEQMFKITRTIHEAIVFHLDSEGHTFFKLYARWQN